VRVGDRATEFGQQCRQLGANGQTSQGKRHAWAEKAKFCDYSERFSHEVSGHNSNAVHRAYEKRALMEISSLEDHENK